MLNLSYERIEDGTMLVAAVSAISGLILKYRFPLFEIDSLFELFHNPVKTAFDYLLGAFISPAIQLSWNSWAQQYESLSIILISIGVFLGVFLALLSLLVFKGDDNSERNIK